MSLVVGEGGIYLQKIRGGRGWVMVEKTKAFIPPTNHLRRGKGLPIFHASAWNPGRFLLKFAVK